MRHYEEYQAVKKFPLFKGYLEHFRQTSMENDIPGMLSFFFLQGQVSVPFVRIPWGPSHLDPRVHVFWIQPSRSGKSVSWEFIGDICREAEIPTDMYTTGTDAALIGGWTMVGGRRLRYKRASSGLGLRGGDRPDPANHGPRGGLLRTAPVTGRSVRRVHSMDAGRVVTDGGTRQRFI